ncbi:hypothetical protein KFE98_04450 [bacterium SCSIO 12741]|nr:hypothetical protein KFE98_04450 [bacterium SCSIO 12741]
MKLTLSAVWMATLVIAAVLFSYFYYQLSRNEEVLIRQGKRSLQTIQQAISEKEALYEDMSYRKISAKRAVDSLAQRIPRPKSYEGLKAFHDIMVSSGIHLQTFRREGKNVKSTVQREKGLRFRENGTQINLLLRDTQYLSMDFYGYMEDLVNTDFFDKVAIFRLGHIYYQSPAGFLPYHISDTLLNEKRMGELAATKNEIEVSGQKFRYFVLPLKIQEKDYKLIGFMNLTRFNRARGQIDYTVLGFVFCLLLLLICAVPVIRYFSLGKGDRLSKIRVYEGGFSVVLIAMVFGLSLGYFSNYFTLFHRETVELDERTEELAEKFAGYLQEKEQKLKELKKAFPNVQQVQNGLIAPDQFVTIDNDTGVMQNLIEPQFYLFNPPETVGDLSHRDYVRVFLKKGVSGLEKQELESDLNSDREVFLSSHYSIGTSQFEGVVSLLDGEQILAHTFGFSDWDSRILNPLKMDHKYMIIRSNGDVLYNPNLKKERLNNVFENTEFSDNLKSLITSGVDRGNSFFSLKGHGQEVAFRSIDWSPDGPPRFYVLTYFDRDIPAMLSSSAVALCMSLAIALVVLGYLLALVLAAGGYRSTWFKVPPYSASWFRPSQHLNKAYLRLSFVFVILAVFQLYVYGRFSHQIFLLALICAEILVFVAWISYAVVFRYRHLENRQDKRPFHVLFSLVSWLLILVISALIWDYQSKGQVIWPLLGLWGIQGGFLLIFRTSWSGKVLTPILHVLERFSPAGRLPVLVFTCMLVCWVIVIGYMPTLVLTNAAINLEDDLWQKAGKDLALSAKKKKVMGWDSFRRFDFLLYRAMRIQMNNVSENEKQIELFHNLNPISFNEIIWKPDPLGATKDQPYYRGKWLARFIGFLFFLALLFPLIHLLVCRIFLVKVIQSKSIIPDDWHESGVLPAYSQASRTLCMGPYYSGRTRKMTPDLAKSSADPCQVDLIELDSIDQLKRFMDQYDPGNPSCQKLVMHNFDYLLYRSDRLDQFLVQFERLVSTNELDLLVYSNSSLDEILEKIQENRWFNEDERYSGSELAQLVDRFEYLLASFATIKVPLAEPSDADRNILNEFAFGPNLKDFEPTGIPDSMTTLQSDRLIYQIIQYNKAYYLSIWSSLTLREKHLIYDTAENGYVNYANRDVLIRMVDKGLFVIDHKNFAINLFNQSFRYFVLDVVNDREREGFSMLQSRTGNWKNVRVLVIVLIAGLVIFMYLTDPGIFNKSLGILSSLAAVIGIVAQTVSGAQFKNFLPFLKSGGGSQTSSKN